VTAENSAINVLKNIADLIEGDGQITLRRTCFTTC